MKSSTLSPIALAYMTNSIALLNAKIYTDWHSQPVQALIVNNGLVEHAGTNQDILNICNTSTKKHDLAGMTVWPGLCDAHIHVEQLSKQLAAVNCEGLSKQEILQAIKQRADQVAAGEWIIGYGFNQNDWQPPEYGTAQELDAVSPNNPVLIHAKSLHAAWANTMAMRLAGIHANSPDPEAGTFLRHQDGSPNGILLEYAISSVSKHIPDASPSQLAQDLLKTQTHLHSLGISAVHDFDGIASAQAFLDLATQDKLRLRVTKLARMENFDRIISENWHKKLQAAPFLSPGWLKLFADGALGPQSAAMLEPYEKSTNRGMLLMSREEMIEIGHKASQHGWSLSIHAIGDLAARTCLDAIEALQKLEPHPMQNGRFPHRIEHIQALNPQDLARFKQLGVIASVQPLHATSDYLTAERLWGKRCEHAYAYKSLLDSGAELFVGTDAPVEPANPFHTLHAAISRQTLAGEPKPHGWYPQQALSLKETLAAMTTNPARYFATSAQTGMLKPGSNADFILFKDDPFSLPISELARISPEKTFIAGEEVFSK